MNIKSANFVIAHKGKRYSVDFLVQDTDSNNRRAIVSVWEVPEYKGLLTVSMRGRQLICPENAKAAIKQALKKQEDTIQS